MFTSCLIVIEVPWVTTGLELMPPSCNRNGTVIIPLDFGLGGCNGGVLSRFDRTATHFSFTHVSVTSMLIMMQAGLKLSPSITKLEVLVFLVGPSTQQREWSA